MESSSKKSYLFILSLSFLFFLSFTDTRHPKSTYPEFDETTVKARVEKMTSDVVEPRYDIIVKSYLRTYLVRSRAHSENILGKSVVYFPVFEKHLKAHNLPADLKYLPIVESALNPKATSRAKAVGLWQFMAPTAKEYGLKINNYVDERCDPEKSTEAAMKHLHFLYRKYEDWALVLAAYNGGSGRVSRAVKRARSKNYWRARKYLPKETHNYVPAFIAATYLVKHFEEHELTPVYPSLDLQITETIEVFDEFSFFDIAKVTELPLDVIEALNPAYGKGLIPADETGNFITLPKRVMTIFKEYVESRRPDMEQQSVASTPVLITRSKEELSANYIKSFYTVKEGETLEKVAQHLNFSVHQLKAWNQLGAAKLQPGQQLLVYYPKNAKRPKEVKKIEVLSKLTALPTPAPQTNAPSARSLKAEEAFQSDLHWTYVVKRREKLKDIALRIPGVITEDLEALNGISGNTMLKPGTIIKLKKLNR